MSKSPDKVPTAGIRPEAELLLCCARTCMDAERAERMRALLRGGIDWSYLLRMARPHGLMPLLYWNLHTTCPESVPAAVLHQLQRHFNVNDLHNRSLTRELLKLLRLFETHEILAVPYKGPTLAATAYGNLSLRQFGDLDILVHERDYQRAQHLLIGQGFRITIEHEWEVELKDGCGGVAVDLHRRITQRDIPCPLSFEYLSRRLQPRALGGTMVPNLC